MTPDWSTPDGSVQLWCRDCLEVLPTLEASSVVTDPVWPNASIPLAGSDQPYDLWRSAWARFPGMIRRVAVQLGCDSDPGFVEGMHRRWTFFRTCWLEYVRPHYRGRLLFTGDVAFLFGEPPAPSPGRMVVPGRYMPNTINQEKPRTHPCPRKLEHVIWLVNRWTDYEDAVLDPFMGSGTTAIACIRTGRRFLGVEIDERYFELAVKRIEAELKRTPLFPPEPIHVTEHPTLF